MGEEKRDGRRNGERANRPAGGPQSLFSVALFATLLGSCGTCSGAASLGEDPIPVVSSDLSPDDADAQRHNLHLIRSPHDDAIRASQLVVSLMLLAGGAMLSLRRKNARWWMKNALAANMVWYVGHAALSMHHYLQVADQLMPVRGETPNGIPVSLVVLAVALGIYVHLWIRVGRLDDALFETSGP